MNELGATSPAERRPSVRGLVRWVWVVAVGSAVVDLLALVIPLLWPKPSDDALLLSLEPIASGVYLLFVVLLARSLGDLEGAAETAAPDRQGAAGSVPTETGAPRADHGPSAQAERCPPELRAVASMRRFAIASIVTFAVMAVATVAAIAMDEASPQGNARAQSKQPAGDPAASAGGMRRRARDPGGGSPRR